MNETTSEPAGDGAAGDGVPDEGAAKGRSQDFEAAEAAEAEEPTGAEPPPRVRLRVDLDPRVNFALQQNAVPPLKRVVIESQHDEDLDDLRLFLVSEPAFAREGEVRLDRLAAGAVHELEELPLVLSPAYLDELHERVRGSLRLELWQGERLLTHEELELELYARDEWGGLGSLPQILAAFVLPNDPAVAEVLGEAARLLESWTGDPSLAGYQRRDRGEVAQVAAAVYEAVAARGLSYINPPASFEALGQKVRLPGRVLAGGMATCLDAALLLAACWEQCGLHPLVVLERDHAYAGLWLDEASFPDPVDDVASRLAQRVELGEILVVEAVGVTSSPARSFEDAVESARRRAVELGRHVATLDVHRARLGGIRPLPERGAVDETLEEGERPAGPAPDLARLGLEGRGSLGATPAAESPASRLERWRTKLLDLSLRNRLLDTKVTRTTVPLWVHDLARLEDALAEGQSFRIRPRPAELGARDPRSGEDGGVRAEGARELLASELESGRLCADLAEGALERHLVELYRSARTEREEGGVSALFLALGFLHWYEAEGSRERRAPLLLLPLELSRSSVRSGFSVSLADEDARLNVTLLEKLRVDFGLEVGGLSVLPQDERGVDVAALLRAFREVIRDQDRWVVRDEAAIGLFSFSKFLMWTDLAQRAEGLLENPLVAHMVNRPGAVFDPEAVFPAPEELDSRHSPAETFCPLAADSSQLAAIWAAAEGRSFVLEGPPGTGKSQTITNLIAHCLSEGKRVLFVSEKMAALEVVRVRLEGLGLGEFCLELHSNKTRKREVVEQLAAALDAHAPLGAEEREGAAAELARLRGELADYVRALHEVRPSGERLHTGLAHLVAAEGPPPRVELPRLEAPGALEAARESLAGLGLADELSAPVAAHPWRASRRTEVAPSELAPLGEEARAASRAAEELGEALGVAREVLGFDAEALSADGLDACAELALELGRAPGVPAALVVRPDREEVFEEARALVERVVEREGRRRELLGRHEASLLDLDHEALRADWVKAEGQLWPLSWLGRHKVLAALALCTKGGSRPTREEVPELLSRASELARCERELAARRDEARGLFGRVWRDGEPEVAELNEALRWARSLRDLARRLAAGSALEARDLREGWALRVAEEREALAAGGELRRHLDALRAAWEREGEAREDFVRDAELDEARAFGDLDAPGALERRGAALDLMARETSRLREWCGWRRARRAAADAGLEDLLRLLEDGELEVGELRGAFDHAWYARWCAEVFETEPVLKNFLRQEHERRVADFRALTRRFAELTRDSLRARLASRVPPPSTRELESSETGLLRRQQRLKRRHKPVRALLRELPNLLPRLKPCFLMSPLSVAQYLEPDHPPFDLVVFDEASQIPVWDAIGVLARARQAVIVGDPKQLPPTTFFERGESEDEAEWAEDFPEDLESILDEGLACGLPTLSLDWHYRSRHESLIAFSNQRYYEGRLVTFPAPRRGLDGVTWQHVEGGVYEKGSTRTNPAEAQAIVAEVRRRLLDPERAHESLGVVTFNQAQETLIEDLLEAARREDAALDAAFGAGDGREAVFVKNLENVQGDERDVILFSITYGADADGRVSMNFGPLNREGGERRLNVAITRARRECLVFSSLAPHQIDLARTAARGVRDLKAFLEYAARDDGGVRVAAAGEQGEARAFERHVAQALRARGWEVDENLGRSVFRLDLAVRDPREPERYLAGIECDGVSYAAAKTVRDRDASRPGVLEGLGWTLLRVWSCDWWYDAAGELERLVARLESLRDAERDDSAPPSEEPAPRLATAPAKPARRESSGPEPYAPFPTGEPQGEAEAFYEGRTNRTLRAVMRKIVEAEGPVSLDLVARRLAALWQLGSVRAKTLERVRELVPDAVVLRDSGGAEFLWPSDLDPLTWREHRPAREGDESSERAVEDLALEEIRNAAHAELRAHVALPLEDLARETARRFGYTRLGSAMRERLLAGVELLVTEGVAEREGDSIELC